MKEEIERLRGARERFLQTYTADEPQRFQRASNHVKQVNRGRHRNQLIFLGVVAAITGLAAVPFIVPLSAGLSATLIMPGFLFWVCAIGETVIAPAFVWGTIEHLWDGKRKREKLEAAQEVVDFASDQRQLLHTGQKFTTAQATKGMRMLSPGKATIDAFREFVTSSRLLARVLNAKYRSGQLHERLQTSSGVLHLANPYLLRNSVDYADDMLSAVETDPTLKAYDSKPLTGEHLAMPQGREQSGEPGHLPEQAL